MADTQPLLKGTLDVLVLRALAHQVMHGFEITVWLEERSGGTLSVDDGALYQALHRMESRKLIEAHWGTTPTNRRARYYRLTARGRAFLRTQSAALVSYARSMLAILARDPI